MKWLYRVILKICVGEFHAYNDGVSGWVGWYEWKDKPLCFVADDGEHVYRW